MTVVVMVKEPVLKDGVKEMLDQKTTVVITSKMKLTTLFMITIMTNTVMLLLSTLNVTTKEMSSKLKTKSPVLNGNQSLSVYQEEKPSKSMIYVTSKDKMPTSLNLSLVS